MPMINYPNVPKVPGVPDIRRDLANTNNDTSLPDWMISYTHLGPKAKFILNNLPLPIYGILTESWEAIVPDSVLSMSFNDSEQVSQHQKESVSASALPVQSKPETEDNEKFRTPTNLTQSLAYDKIAGNLNISLVLACAGKGVMSRDVFLQVCSALLHSTKLCMLITPDAIYSDLNCIGMSYSRSSDESTRLLKVSLELTRVFTPLNKTFYIPNVAKDSGVPLVNRGFVQPLAK